jgi:Tol biopolymer transport system component
VGEPGLYDQHVLSPRGRHVTVVRGDADANNWDLWDADLAIGIFSRLTTHAASDDDPAWSPDERALAFSSERTGQYSVFVKDLVSGKEEQLHTVDGPVVVDEWTPDGSYVIVRTLGKAVYALPMSGDLKLRCIVRYMPSGLDRRRVH